ncbi:hypothetical protein [Rathayibacter sp. VKM Ac-2754]|uniref:hypothetical protein n=1 Tax=Rathayibacter sp. VKM Ac-2754 TaxID=2609251 RepID=UPI00135A2D07|nr:hypothetical protein [Rathayibacter sp. VKM Ac-2754]MWV58808.1 hypothetical protein [Rathayibacter sp. VKM Ac-2754]
MDEPRERGRLFSIAGVTIVAVTVLFALVYYFSSAVFATEGDVPAASAISLPEGSEVVDESVECASGGCWALLSVRPPEVMTPEELSSELGTTPQARIPGTLWDPRTITVSSRVDGPLLIVRADFWSREVTP